MKNRDENVKNELAYFYTVIKNMDKKDFIKRSKINEHEISLDEFLYDQILAAEEMDKHLEEQGLLNWIETIKSPELYEAVKDLSKNDQIFLSYIIKLGLTQRELAKIYGVSQKNVNKRFHHIIKKIKHFLK